MSSKICAKHPDIRGRIDIRHSDANAELKRFCSHWPKISGLSFFSTPSEIRSPGIASRRSLEQMQLIFGIFFPLVSAFTVK